MTNELKTYSAHIFELGCMNQQVYLKSEADKVIAELKEKLKIAEEFKPNKEAASGNSK